MVEYSPDPPYVILLASEFEWGRISLTFFGKLFTYWVKGFLLYGTHFIAEDSCDISLLVKHGKVISGTRSM